MNIRNAIMALALTAALAVAADSTTGPAVPPADTIKSTFFQAFNRNTPNQQRLPMVEQLINWGPAAAPAIGDDVAKRLMETANGPDTNLLRLAGSFGEQGAACVPGITKFLVTNKPSPGSHNRLIAPAVEALGNIGSAAASAVPSILAATEKSTDEELVVVTTALSRTQPEWRCAVRSPP